MFMPEVSHLVASPRSAGPPLGFLREAPVPVLAGHVSCPGVLGPSATKAHLPTVRHATALRQIAAALRRHRERHFPVIARTTDESSRLIAPWRVRSPQRARSGTSRSCAGSAPTGGGGRPSRSACTHVLGANRHISKGRSGAHEGQQPGPAIGAATKSS